MSSIHRHRKKKKAVSGASHSDHGAVITIHETGAQAPAIPLAAFFWPARKSASQWVILPLSLMVVGLFRWVVGFWGYSGFNCPPMHGDFEAQRHWMEITIHLPISQWYFYDLPYWGLDYPPLTAYHSWFLGKIGSYIEPAWFALQSSRGFEDQPLKVYMRATVLVSDYLIHIPAAIVFNRRLARLQGVSTWESSIVLVAVLMQPATILIDYAHFQYNTVMLGFVLASLSSVLAGRFLWSCVFFVCALCFKQMALYFAPAVFAYLAGSCIIPNLNVNRFLSMAIVTVLSLMIIFAPLILGSELDFMRSPALVEGLEPPPLLSILPISVKAKKWSYPLLLQLGQAIHRIFPFARGIFEDKVANIWCCIHTIHKLNHYPIPMLQRISLSATLVSILPACMIISLFPRKELLPWAMASCAWGFFLFSFQVHEKSVLLPLLPMTVLLGGEGGLGIEMRAWVGWANMLGVWTLYPLLKRDELRVPYAVLALLWSYLLGLPPAFWGLYSPGETQLALPTKLLHIGFYAGMLVWHGFEAFVAPPTGKPDLWVVINVIIGAAGFGVCWLWCTWQLILRSGVLQDYFGWRSWIEKQQRGAEINIAKKKQ